MFRATVVKSMTGARVLYLSVVSNENVSSHLSTDWLTDSVQRRPAPLEWKTASTGTESKTVIQLAVLVN